MAKRRRGIRKGYRRKPKIPVAVVLGFLPLVATAVSDVQAGGFQGLRNTATCVIPYSPANKKFTTARLHLGLYPMVAGFLVHKIVGGWLGVNRAIAAAGVPMIRL
jgi:hypothetical protein